MSSNIVFMGTPDFAVPALQQLHAEFGVGTVVTVPDKPKGRGLSLQKSAVRIAAEQLGISNILTPTSLRDAEFETQIKHIAPSIICVIAFRILPKNIYSVATQGAFNVHASLLPRFRGAAPINHAIMRGEKKSGVTSFLLNDVVDTGNILGQIEIDIPQFCTAGELYELLKPLAADCAVDTCKALLGGYAAPLVQTDELATPAKKIFRDECKIDLGQPASDTVNFVHGVSPVPCAWTTWQGQVLKIFRCLPSGILCPVNEFRIIDNTFVIGCSDGAIQLTEIQLPGKQRVKVDQFLHGYRGPMSGPIS
ncbi:MAG: methionyl-tRNA formyltransferase [Ignavibacteria bacterium]|nr:methionyl-tRNA formyltransferase [Ignavibacteria bacterium]